MSFAWSNTSTRHKTIVTKVECLRKLGSLISRYLFLTRIQPPCSDAPVPVRDFAWIPKAEHQELVRQVQHRSTPIPLLQPSCDEKQSTMASSSCSFRRLLPSRFCGSPNSAHNGSQVGVVLGLQLGPQPCRTSLSMSISQALHLWLLLPCFLYGNLQGYQKQTPIGAQENSVSTKLNCTLHPSPNIIWVS